MDNTLLIDSSLILLAIVGGWFWTGSLYRNRRTTIRKFPLFLINVAALWSLFNWVTHIIAVLFVNIERMFTDTFVYTFHFYAMILMGITFTALSVFQLSRIRLLCMGKYYLRNQLTLVSWSIILLSLPIFPLNPIGLLPVISSTAILMTMAFTRSQWQPTACKVQAKKIVSA